MEKMRELRLEMRRLLSDALLSNGSVRVSDVTASVVAKLLKQKKVVEAALPDLLKSMAAEEAGQVLHKSRRRLLGDVAIDDSDPEEAVELLEEDEANAVSEWGRWLEQTSDGHVPVVQMNRPQLREAVRIRGEGIAGDLVAMAVLTRIQKGLPDDETRVRDHYSIAELDTLKHDVLEGGTDGMLRLTG